MTSDGGEASASLPDLVYLVRSGENEELRYSLRSIAQNAKGLYREIWVVGTGLPDWLTNVNVLPIPDGLVKHETMRAKTLAISEHVELSQTFGLMNDDYFLVKPIKEWVVYHMGSVSEWVAKKIADAGQLTSYLRDVRSTALWMEAQGYGDVLCRETHSITIWDKTLLVEALKKYPRGRGLTTVELYDMAGAGGEGEFALNAKVHHDDHLHAKLSANDSPWLSSSDESFANSRIGDYMREMFPDPSKYEKGA